MHLKSTADFSLNAADIKTKYLLVNGDKGTLYFAPKYSLACYVVQAPQSTLHPESLPFHVSLIYFCHSKSSTLSIFLDFSSYTTSLIYDRKFMIVCITSLYTGCKSSSRFGVSGVFKLFKSFSKAVFQS